MLYVNISKERKLIPSKRVKVWVNPRESVEIDSVDEKFLGINASALMPKVKYDKKIAKKAKKKAKKAAAAAAAKAEMKAKKKAPVKKEEAPVKVKITKAVKKVVTKKKVDVKKPTAAELRAQRTELKESLSKKNKADIVSFGEDVLDMKIKKTEKKDVILNKVLNAAKKFGYKKAIKNA